MSMEMLVIFAHWCPKCNMMMPIAEEIEVDFADRLRVTWIDLEKDPEMCEKYEIEIVPTFIINFEGKEVARMAGMIGEKILRARIEDEIRTYKRT